MLGIDPLHVIAMSGQVLLERQIPLRWSKPADAGASAPINPLAFAMLETLDEGGHSPRTEAEPQADIQRLEAKLNLILQLLAQLLHKDALLPAALPVRFASDALAWPAGNLRSGDPVVVQLYLEPALPVPVMLRGEVRVAEGWASLGLDSLSEEQQAGWSRWVFRQHRRDVARHRQQANA